MQDKTHRKPAHARSIVRFELDGGPATLDNARED
jgi:hypothetical protein